MKTHRHAVGIATSCFLPKVIALALAAHAATFTADYYYLLYAGCEDTDYRCGCQEGTEKCDKHWFSEGCQPCRDLGDRSGASMTAAFGGSMLMLLLLLGAPVFVRSSTGKTRCYVGFGAYFICFVAKSLATVEVLARERDVMPYGRIPTIEVFLCLIMLLAAGLSGANAYCYAKLTKEQSTRQHGWALLGDMERGYANRPSDMSMAIDTGMWSVILMGAASATLIDLKEGIDTYERLLEAIGVASILFTLYYVILWNGWGQKWAVNPVTNTSIGLVEDYFADEDAKIRFLVLLTCVPPIKPIGTEFSCLSDLTQPQPLGRYKLQRPVTWECLQALLTEEDSRVRYVKNGEDERVYVKKSVGKVYANGSVRVVERRNASGEDPEQQQVVICYELERVSELEWHAVEVWETAGQAEHNSRKYDTAPSFSSFNAADRDLIAARVGQEHVITVGSPEANLHRRCVKQKTVDDVLSKLSEIAVALNAALQQQAQALETGTGLQHPHQVQFQWVL